jgi:hypothetical protein
MTEKYRTEKAWYFSFADLDEKYYLEWLFNKGKEGNTYEE